MLNPYGPPERWITTYRREGVEEVRMGGSYTQESKMMRAKTRGGKAIKKVRSKKRRKRGESILVGGGWEEHLIICKPP